MKVELVVVIGKGGNKITETKAMDHMAGYALALDMRDCEKSSTGYQEEWMALEYC